MRNRFENIRYDCNFVSPPHPPLWALQCVLFSCRVLRTWAKIALSVWRLGYGLDHKESWLCWCQRQEIFLTRNIPTGSGPHTTHSFLFTLHRSFFLWEQDGRGLMSSCPCSSTLHPTTHSPIILEQVLTLWCRIFFFLILAHSVYKMWIIKEPNKLALWNKLHFEEKKKRRV